jgi:hypothetical protein
VPGADFKVLLASFVGGRQVGHGGEAGFCGASVVRRGGVASPVRAVPKSGGIPARLTDPYGPRLQKSSVRFGDNADIKWQAASADAIESEPKRHDRAGGRP